MNTFSDPQKIIGQCDVYPGQQIADLGAGSGVYTLALAEKIKGDIKSKVFAIDIQKDLLSRIAAEAKDKNLSSVHIVWGDIEEPAGTKLKEHSINTAFIANTLFQVEDRKTTIQEAKRILHPDGRLVIIDWSESFGNIGPKADSIITEEAARTLCEEVGLKFEHSLEVGEHHYGFIMRNQ